MFFKEDKNHDRNATNWAYYITFVYWAVILFVNYIFEVYKGRELISNSGTILITGVILLFVSEFIIKKMKKSQE